MFKRLKPDPAFLKEMEAIQAVQEHYYTAESNKFDDITVAIEKHFSRMRTIEERRTLFNYTDFDWLIAHRNGITDIGSVGQMSLLKRLEFEIYSSFMENEEDMQDDLRLPPEEFMMDSTRRNLIDDLINS